ncbi:Putative transcription elongation factor S-II [Toxocara canis]|uniref:Transcription elongation factor n=1 Tax=Toxocara canis TaxID=6265 RepID=A0A0B2UW07_TOXCA|nr:Putative transcription elongation factor S-II [Toxocara canis]
MASCEDEVMRIGKKFEKMIQGTKSMDGALELLDALSALPVNINVLTKTRIGMTINDLRKKTSDEHVSKRAKSLIKEWKNLLENKNHKGNGAARDIMPRTDSGSSNLSEDSASRSSSHHPAASAAVKHSAPVHPPAPTRQFSGDEANFSCTRNKCTEMIINALKSRELPDGTLDPEDLAIRIEKKLYEVHRGTGDKYKSAVRSRVFNLRDKKNGALRENVLTGVVTPEKFALMTSEEMASDEMKSQREKFTKQAIEEHQMSVQEGTPSDMFKCGKCGKKNCTYTQVQTRSADEPMTTFVFCRECGNRWKFC